MRIGRPKPLSVQASMLRTAAEQLLQSATRRREECVASVGFKTAFCRHILPAKGRLERCKGGITIRICSTLGSPCFAKPQVVMIRSCVT
jgi:hypothetical protein